MSESLKKLRTEKKLTQAQAADILNVSLRLYKSYENEESKKGSIKYRYMVRELEEYHAIDETHGILAVSDITFLCDEIFKKYGVEYAYLFGSYAKGTASEKSDVDLLVSSSITGLRFFGLIEELKNALHKNVDVLDLNQLGNNKVLINEILKDGIKIYG